MPGRSLNVALVAPAWPPGGFPNGVIPYVESTFENLSALGHRAVILTQHQADGAADFGPEVVDVRPSIQGSGKLSKLLDRVAMRIAPAAQGGRIIARPIVRALRTPRLRGVEIVEMEEVFGWAGWVRRGSGRPMVVRLHGPWFLNGPLRGAADDAAFRDRVWSEGRAIARADGVTAPSRDVLDRTRKFYGIPLPHARVIFNPAPSVPDDRLWRQDAAEPGSVLFVGRFDLHKGGDLILDAFARLARDRPDAKLWFAGPDQGLVDPHGRRWTLPEYVAEHCRDCGDRVHWLGPLGRAEIEALRLRSMVTVVCSRYETFGMTVTEAMAHGSPVVATRAGAFPEILHDDRTGLLCAPDDPVDLAARIGELLDNPTRGASLGAEAVRSARDIFGARMLAEQTAAYYHDVLGRSPSAEVPPR